MTVEPIHVRVMLFAQLRELCGGESEIVLEVHADADVNACFDALARRYGRIERLRPHLVVAVNEEYAAWDHRVRDGDAVVFVPPVSGGSGPGPFRVSDRPVSGDEVEALVGSDRAGAVVTFLGVVRDHHEGRAVSHLEYEAYAPMAERVFAEIAATAERRWPLEGIAIHHRVGRLEVGEASVAIAVSAAHRGEAFEACRFVIDRLKSVAPIWKRETGPDGSRWVEGPDTVPGAED